jgi:hypothetical protein
VNISVPPTGNGRPGKTDDTVTQQTRLSVNLSRDVADELKEYAGAKGVSVTEAVRRAIAILVYVADVQDRGASLNVEDNGVTKEVLFMV